MVGSLCLALESRYSSSYSYSYYYYCCSYYYYSYYYYYYYYYYYSYCLVVTYPARRGASILLTPSRSSGLSPPRPGARDPLDAPPSCEISPRYTYLQVCIYLRIYRSREVHACARAPSVAEPRWSRSTDARREGQRAPQRKSEAMTAFARYE